MGIELRVGHAGGGQELVSFETTSATDALRMASRRGLRVLAVEKAAPPAAAKVRSLDFPLQSFSQELVALLEAGLTVSEALDTLIAKEERAATREVLAAVRADTRQGRNFSAALGRQPACFPAIYVATVRAAESSGNLPGALARYVAYAAQFETVRRKVIGASIYPAILLLAGSLVTLFLTGYVVPRFAAVFQETGRVAPWASQLLMAAGRSIHSHWLELGAALMLAAVALGGAISRPSARRSMVLAILRLPWLAQRAREYRLARFYRTLGLLLDSGIPLGPGLGMTSGLLPMGEAVRLAAVRRGIEEGLPLSLALERERLTTPVALSLMRVAEKSGRLADMLERVGRFHDEELARRIDWASRMIEPLLMTAMGVVIGGVVVLLYMPIFDLAGGLQ